MGHYPLPWWAVELQESGSGSSAACPVGSETERKASTGAPKGRLGLPMACCPLIDSDCSALGSDPAPGL